MLSGSTADGLCYEFPSGVCLRGQKDWGKGMKPAHQPVSAKLDRNRRTARPGAVHTAIAVLSLVFLTGCEQNAFVPPPPPAVDVALPYSAPLPAISRRPATPRRSSRVDLVARVQGVLQAINYQDGAFVKEGTTLFTIEPETYQLKLEQAQAAEAGAQASLKQAEADYKRQATWSRGRRSRRRPSISPPPTRDNAQANLQQAQVNTKIAAINFGYTDVTAPFDGIVSAHLVSVGELVGAASPTQLATIVQLDPIYVNFNVNEQDVLRVRAEAARRGLKPSDLKQLPIEVGLQTETRLSAQGQARLCLADGQSVDRNARGARCAAECRPRIAARLFRPCPRSLRSGSRMRCWCPTWRWAATKPAAMCWS